MNFSSLLVYFVSMIFTANGVETNPVCDCNNPVYIDQPTNIAQCYLQTKFYDQINANYKITHGFLDQDSAKHCNYTAFRSIVNEMKMATQQIVASYFNCTKRDCEPTVMAAFFNYRDVVITKFGPYLACSYTYFTPECAVNIKHSTFFSAENILSTLIECARLKASCQRPDFRLLLNDLFPKKNTPDCNCVKIDPRPIPVSEEQCYSPEYIDTVKKFITNNVARIMDVYRNATTAHPQCDYSDFVGRIKQFEGILMQWPNILEDPFPTFQKLSLLPTEMTKLAIETNEATRAYVLAMDKDCYFTPRQVRQSALTIGNYVIQILTKCVKYKDPSNSKC